MRAMRQLILMLTIPAMLVGCRASGVGDPCTPEIVPPGGFNMAETYLETSSVQCRTRVCMVYQLAGDPTVPREECEAMNGLGACPDSPSQRDIDASVYCTCRCDAPDNGTDGAGVPLCECGEGFVCQAEFVLGGDGIRGTYCVKEETVTEM